MDRKQFKFWQKIIALILTLTVLVQPAFGVYALAQEITPSPEPTQAQELSESTQVPQPTLEPTSEPQNTQIEPTGAINEPNPSPSITAANEDTAGSNEANASDSQTTTVTNNNDTEVVNDVNAVSNTGNNEINPSANSGEAPTPTTTPELTQDSLSKTPTPAEITSASEESATSTADSADPTPSPEVLPTSSAVQPTGTPGENTGGSLTDPEVTPTPTDVAAESLSATPTPSAETPPTPGPVAENIETPADSQNQALCTSQEETAVGNDNEANVNNAVTGEASSGQNSTTGEAPEIETGDTSVEANLANITNLNLVGEDFWAEVFNLLGVNNGDLDFSSIDMQQKLNEAMATVMARNLSTGNGSVNIAGADFLNSLVVSNNNIATVANVLDLSAISGQNTAVGGDGVVNTGNASVTANLFNLINTNLIGNNFWFGVFNIFGEQNGDLILPYELQFLQTEKETETETEGVAAINQNAGVNSQNLAVASESDITKVNNNNEATVTNDVDLLADSGTNTAGVGGSAEIKTGDASTKVDIRNFVNTNIFGGKFVFLLINVFGQWQGMLLNWWGKTETSNGSVLAVGQLPPAPQPTEDGSVTATNQNTGDNSQNLAEASSTTSLEVTNNNQATLTNEIKGEAISGQNDVYGDSGKVQTGNSSVVANIANFVNTNIVGNNFFFGIINIFGKFTGNILFPRPDLELSKSVDKNTAAPGETLTYTITYKNIGRVWAKDVVITDNFPAGINFVSASNGGVFEGGKVIWKIAKINPGEVGGLSVTINIVNSGFSDGTQLINQALISTSTDEPNKGNNQGSANTIIKIASAEQNTDGNGNGANGNGGVGGNSNAAGSSSSGSAETCIPPEAPKVPTLLSAENVSSTEVKLSWTAVDRASYYLVAYGQTSKNYVYGSPNVGNVTSYIVGGLTPGQTYYFVVAAVVDNGCPVAGLFSNELSNSNYSGTLGLKEVLAQEGEIGEGASAETGEVAGAETKSCPWWWIVLGAGTLSLAGFYGLVILKAKSLKYWWLVAPLTALLAFLGDKIAHHWWVPGQYCQYIPWGGLAIGSVESLGFKILEKRKAGK